MACMGPGRSYTDDDIDCLVETIYPEVEYVRDVGVPTYSLLRVCHKAFENLWEEDGKEINGYHADQFDLTRAVYLTYGWFCGKMPSYEGRLRYENMEVGLRSPRKQDVNFTKEEFKTILAGLLYQLDCEDF